jgi:hypothetical protein
MHDMHTAVSKVENPAQVTSCFFKFVHANIYFESVVSDEVFLFKGNPNHQMDFYFSIIKNAIFIWFGHI